MKTHRKLFFTLLIASTTGIIHAQNVFNDPAVNEEQRLDDLIARMTLDEKWMLWETILKSPAWEYKPQEV